MKLGADARRFHTIRRLFRSAERLERIFQVLFPVTLLGELIETLGTRLGQDGQQISLGAGSRRSAFRVGLVLTTGRDQLARPTVFRVLQPLLPLLRSARNVFRNASSIILNRNQLQRERGKRTREKRTFEVPPRPSR